MPYKKTVEGDKTRFDTIPETAPIFLFYAILPLSIPLIFLYVIQNSMNQDRYLHAHNNWFTIALVLVAIWVVVRQFHPTVTRYRSNSTFSVSPDGIEFNGKFYPAQDIQRIVERNNVDPIVVTIYGTAPTGTAAGFRYRKALMNVSYRVDMESNGVVKTLAGGLNGAAGFAIIIDISQILGRQLR